jgi:hypothetical protein
MKLLISNISALELSEIHLIRAMGEPVEWRFAAKMTRDSRGGSEVEQLASALSGSPVTAFAQGQEGGLSRSGPPATVVGALWRRGDVDVLDIQALGTKVAPDPNPFLPRRRVHRARTMRALLDKFQHVCHASTGVLTELGRITFPDDGHASIVQDGLSDWEFVGHVLDQCNLLRPGAPWLPLTLMGGVSPQSSTSGKWVVTPGCRQAYESWSDVDRRKLHFRDDQGSDGCGRIEFGSISSKGRSPSFPHGIIPAPIYWRQDRKFDDGAWQRWSTIDLPRFTSDGVMIWKIVDRLYNFGQSTIEWESRLWTMPPDAIVPSPIPSVHLRPWIGLGKITGRSPKGYWLQTELPGFESGENAADVRLTTPYSGRDGRKGVHLVPENGTEVEVRWSGRFDASLLFGGNIRSGDANFDSPSLYVEDLFTAQYANVRVPKIGLVAVESSLGMDVKEATKITSSQQLDVKADGADLKMVGGVVYTGRGM